MTFDDAMNTTCWRCGKHASLHRMTARTFYCTVLNAKGMALYDSYRPRYGRVDLDTIVYRTKVKNLEHSSLTGEVRKAIVEGLSTIVDGLQ